MPVDTGVSVWLVGGVRGVLGIPLSEISRAVSTPFPTRQVDGVGRLVPRDLVARPASAYRLSHRCPDRLRSFPGTSD